MIFLSTSVNMAVSVIMWSECPNKILMMFTVLLECHQDREKDKAEMIKY